MLGFFAIDLTMSLGTALHGRAKEYVRAFNASAKVSALGATAGLISIEFYNIGTRPLLNSALSIARIAFSRLQAHKAFKSSGMRCPAGLRRSRLLFIR